MPACDLGICAKLDEAYHEGEAQQNCDPVEGCIMPIFKTTLKERRSNPATRLVWTVLLAAALLFTGASAARAQISIGIQIGPPPPPRVLRMRPVIPGPGYFWVQGYWYPVGRHYRWHAGYWTLPPYAGAYWVPPHYDGDRFFDGYWNGDHGRFEHDHRWDRDHGRDGGRWHGGDDHHGHDHHDDHH